MGFAKPLSIGALQELHGGIAKAHSKASLYTTFAGALQSPHGEAPFITNPLSIGPSQGLSQSP